MNAVFNAAAARRRAVAQELTAAADAALAHERDLAACATRQAALIVERDQLDVWLVANAAVIPPPVTPEPPVTPPTTPPDPKPTQPDPNPPATDPEPTP